MHDTRDNAYSRELDRLLAEVPAPEVTSGAIGRDERPSPPERRGLRAAPPDTQQYGTLTLDEGQQMIRDAITTYLAEPNPGYVLLIAAPAGIGKTTLAVETAERHAAAGGRVMYLGPRRDFFDDLIPLMRHPAWWQEWLPRTLGQGQGVGQTCRYASQIDAWMKRGYNGLDFCSNPRICGWNYIHNGCPWHAQTRRNDPIIFAQYEHLSMGHPKLESTTLLIGDELPLRAFLHAWNIPPAQIVPPEMEPSPRLTLMQRLRQLAGMPAGNDAGWYGAALIEAMGGARAVEAATADIPLAELAPPELRHADAAEQAPYGHLMDTLRLLGREADVALNGRECISRVRVTKDGLTLLLRRTPRHLPPHTIWLDATASEPIYRELLNAPIKVVRPDVALRGTVYQVWSSSNNKTHIAESAPKLQHIKAQHRAITRRGYQQPATVTYKAITTTFGDEASTAHFHGSRGTNRLEESGCLMVIGTPQPSISDLLTTAAMVYFKRDTPFNARWSTQDRPFAGQPWAYPVSGFWDDNDLQALLEQSREAELIQALHRARPLRRQVDVWLLTNVPLPGVPVRLVSLHELFQAPAGVDPYRWAEALTLAEERMADVGMITSAELVKAGVAKPETARQYLETMAALFDWQLTAAPAEGRGRPPLACVKNIAP